MHLAIHYYSLYHKFYKISPESKDMATMLYTKIRHALLTHPWVEHVYHSLVGVSADAYIISFPKSGRTWVRMLLAQVLAREYGLKLNLDLYKMTLGRRIPNIATDPRTGNYARLGSAGDLKILHRFRNKKVIFLVRDPRDVLVSYYFEWNKRREMKYEKDIHSFIREDFTLPRIIAFMNLWAEEQRQHPEQFLQVSYESLHADTARELKRMLDFLQIPASEDTIPRAVEQSSFQSMLGMEKAQRFGDDHRLKPVNPTDRQTYKMRRGKVGGYVDYLTREDIHYIDQLLKEKLNPSFRLYAG